jgi:hypothetical protein
MKGKIHKNNISNSYIETSLNHNQVSMSQINSHTNGIQSQ